ncbi:hypothetical protein [Streptomyces sp. NPDC017448]|uniref:hypothetical protein n=1 Tax=Streptomyces sp. NPDC017448 TaxID=3364996 RepID=UPI00379A4C5B
MTNGVTNASDGHPMRPRPMRRAVPDTSFRAPTRVMELVSAIRSSHEEIDAWLSGAVHTFPVLQDHGFSATWDSRD